ncbi:methionyl-tRNA formyltransferase [Nocardioides sp. MAHUQ-72]|uniref:methionyl-tRNA formyltransferase n=1 Tax=unclassified Nocardioides TaxID=2615069 RepID=UPI00361FD781
MSSDRILVLGMGPTTQAALESLAPRFELCGLVRGEPDDVTRWALDAGIEVFTANRPSEVAGLVDRLMPDLVVVSSYDRILEPRLVARCPFVNVHYAPLPRYRGRATVNWAIINGETETAMTVHCLEPELDAGGILAQVTAPIGPRDTVADLYERLNELQRAALADAVQRRLAGDLGEAQDESCATYCASRVPGDGEIDWRSTTAAVDRLVRGLSGPYPPAFTFAGRARVNILRAHPVEGARVFEGRVPGRVVEVKRTSGEVEVLTGDGVLSIDAVASEHGEEVVPATLIRSVRETLGLRYESLLTRIDELEAKLREDEGGR